MIHIICCLALAGLVLGVEAIAQVAPARIGWALSGSEEASRSNVEAFRDGLRALGHVEGRTYVLDLRYAEGKLERYPKLFVNGNPNFPSYGNRKFPTPGYASASSERTRPAFNFSFSRYELPRMLSVTA